MFFTIEKFEKRVEELEHRRYFGMRSIAPFAAMPGDLPEDSHYHGAPPEQDSREWKEFGLNDFFVGRDRYLWLDKELTLPPAMEGCRVAGRFDFGETGGGNTNGFESLLYVDGHPYQGVDGNHREVLFKDREGQAVRLTFLLWTGLEGGGPHRTFYHQCRQAEVGYLHEKTDEFYYLAKSVTETLRVLSEDDVNYAGLKAALDRALLCIDWDSDGIWTTGGGHDFGEIWAAGDGHGTGETWVGAARAQAGFYASVGQALEVLTEELSRMEKQTDVTVHAVGHTHIDVAWLWRLKHTREKAQRSFATVLRLMDEFDDYVFLQTQPQLYQYIKEDCPEIYEGIRQKIREGKWEPDGGMWVESDCNIPSGESLVRQFLHGTRFIEREFGKKCEYLWLPDVFGYSWALPQILKLCEIDTFMTTKISWNQYNTIPNDLFWWRGIDGTEVLTYFVNTPDEGRGMTDRFSTYSGHMTARSILGSWKKFRNKDLSRETLIAYGYGDGGGGVNREMLMMRRAMDQTPGLPHVKTGTAGAFFRKMHENVERTDRYVPVWDGELYLEYHRGTYTSQAYNKKMNRHMEHKLALAEWLASVDFFSGGSYPQKEINESWECVLLHQFHDIIPGSSIHEVYEDSRVNYRRAEEQVDQVIRAALGRLAGQPRPEVQTEQPRPEASAGKGAAHMSENVSKSAGQNAQRFAVCSVSSFGGQELVHIPVREDGTFYDEEGNVLAAGKTADGWDVQVEVEPFAGRNITFIPGAAEPHDEIDAARRDEASVTAVAPASDTADQQGCEVFRFGDNTLETPFYSIVWNEAGQLTRLYDKQAGRSVLRPGESGNVLEIYEDKPMDFDAWDIDIYYTQKMETMRICEPVRLVERHGLKAVVRFVYAYRKSRLVQDMVVYRDSRRIDFKTHVDWHEDHRLLKTAFYTDIRATKATYDVQFGHVERPTHWNTSWDWARFEVCGHQWADLSETGYGVSLLNDCKYGYSIRDNAMKLTLLKSAKYPDMTADMGEHDFIYALYPHEGAVTEGGTMEEARRLNAPALAVPGGFRDEKKIVRVEEITPTAARGPEEKLPGCVARKPEEKLSGCAARETEEKLSGCAAREAEKKLSGCAAWETKADLAQNAACGVQIDAIKKAEDEDCLIVRMHECRGGRSRVRVSSDYPVRRIVPCNLLEHDLAAEEAQVSAGTAELVFHPFEIKTLKLYIDK